MAPYTPSNDTLAHSGAFSPLPQHDLTNGRSLTVSTVVSDLPTPTIPSISKIVVATPPPYYGIGSLILQPSSNHMVDAESNVSTSRIDSSPRLAYLAILVIPIVGGIAILVFLQRKKQKPAKRPVPPPLTLRSEAIRARADAESPRMQQLPRDRIRAMNSVNRDNEALLSPPADYQIFSPRPPSPLQNEYPRPLGNYFASFSRSSEPSTPFTDSATTVTDFTSCPPTPSTPGLVISIGPVQSPESNTEGGEEGRFTWDFRCKGIMSKLSNEAAEGTAQDAGENAGDASNMTLHEEPVMNSPRSLAPEHSSSSEQGSLSFATQDGSPSTDPNTFPIDPKATDLKTVCHSGMTAGSLTVLDLKLDMTSFSSTVIAALAKSPECLPVEESGVCLDPRPKDTGSIISTKDPKETKKRPVLSRPNHRVLTPGSPSLKGNVPVPESGTLSRGGSVKLPGSFKAEPQADTGRKRSSSEADISVLKEVHIVRNVTGESRAGASGKVSDDISGTVAADANPVTFPDASKAVLQSLQSMPAVELVCLSSEPAHMTCKDT